MGYILLTIRNPPWQNRRGQRKKNQAHWVFSVYITFNFVGEQKAGLGFRVQGLGFRVEGLGFRVQGSGYRV